MNQYVGNALGVTRLQRERVSAGYTLFVPLLSSQALLVNLRGEVVHAWNTPRPIYYGYLLDNGNLLWGGLTKDAIGPGGGRMGSVIEMDWEGEVVWEYSQPELHHDFCRLPNGNTMVLGYEVLPPDFSARVKGGHAKSKPDGDVWSDYFREVTPQGQTVWEWHAYDHLNPDQDVVCPLCNRGEWTHANSCEVLPDGNLLTSFRRLNSVAIIDKSSGGFLWRWGTGELGHQHDPTLLDSGNILIFDNGFHNTEQLPGSRVVEIDPRTDNVVWEYKSAPPWDFFSGHIGGAQRLPNGNTLICEGAKGRLFEVTSRGEIVWEYRNPYFSRHPLSGNTTNSVFRAHRYGPDFPGFRGKTVNPSRWGWLNHL